MSIKYIKENIKKFDHDNLISFLFDIVIRGGLDNVEDFDETKSYVENEKVYFKDVKGIHHIYKCVVDISSPGMIVQDEWIDLLESFRKPIISEETVIADVDIREEVVVATENNQVEFTLKTVGVEDNNARARYMYEKNGFAEPIARIKESYQGDSYEYDLLLKVFNGE